MTIERKEDNEKRRSLKKKLSEKKFKRRHLVNKLKCDDKLVKKISLIFKSKTEKTARKRFNELYEKWMNFQKKSNHSLKTYLNTWIKQYNTQ